MAGTREVVIEAFLDLVAEQGYAATSMDQVAERAGVAKTTIYRRWPSKDNLIVDAHRSLVDTSATPPDTGSLEGDLRALAGTVMAVLNRPRESRVMQASMGEMLTNEPLAKLYREQIIEPRIALIGSLFQRAIERGEVPAEVDWRTLAYVLLGANIFRVAVMAEPPDPAVADRLVRWIAASAKIET